MFQVTCDALIILSTCLHNLVRCCLLWQDKRRNSPFMLYGLLAAEEALRDAAWGEAGSREQALQWLTSVRIWLCWVAR
jgi:hypothetical protein